MHPVKFLSRGRGGGLWWPAGLLFIMTVHKPVDDIIGLIVKMLLEQPVSMFFRVLQISMGLI